MRFFDIKKVRGGRYIIFLLVDGNLQIWFFLVQPSV